MKNSHQAVLLTEVIENLAIKPDGIYIDATFGRGGHSGEILKKLNSNGRLIALDRDLDAIKFAQQEPALAQDARLQLVHTAFSHLQSVAEQHGVLLRVDGILIDLGVSSPQLENAQRGFSFLKSGPLDMRMDTREDLTAMTWINTASEQDMINVFRTYGEERYAKRIASFIVQARTEEPISTTGQLAEIVAKGHPRWERHKHPATRVFQAIRIFINQELEQINMTLPQIKSVLKTGGRLLIISFHSLEDRIVKRFIQSHPADFKRIAKIKPSRAEVLQNPRARSALLRVTEKIS